MAHRPPHPDHHDNARTVHTDDQPPSMPRWVKASLLLLALLALLFVILKLTGIGGNHGPSRHLSITDVTSPVLLMNQPVRQE